MLFRVLVRTVWLSLAFVLLVPRVACADVVGLRNGGVLRGEVEASDDKAAQVDVRTLTGGRIVLDKGQVQTVTRRRLVLEEYESRAKTTPDTVDDQWELALWCRDRHLSSQRQAHLENVVRLDPEHEKARRMLGHVRRNGEWVNKDDAMLRQGYVKYEGEFVTPQERDILEQQDAQREVEKDWHKKIRIWYNWANGRNAQRRDEGIQFLLALNTPDAIPALSRFLKDNRDEAWRKAFVQIVGQIPGERSAAALTLLSLHDEVADVRSRAFDAIGAERYSFVVPIYVAELRNGHNAVVRRAASALGRIGDVNVVPQLIEALVTSHTYRVRVPTNEGTYSFNRGGSMSAGLGPNGDILLPAEVEAALRTGQLQNGVIVVQPNKPMRTKVVTVRRNHENSEVLTALNKLTGESFGYDENAWRAWWSAKQTLNAGAG